MPCVYFSGIPKHEQRRIFEKFVRGSAAREGYLHPMRYRAGHVPGDLLRQKGIARAVQAPPAGVRVAAERECSLSRRLPILSPFVNRNGADAPRQRSRQTGDL